MGILPEQYARALPAALREAAQEIERLHTSEGYDWQKKHAETWGRLLELRVALDGGPTPMCRDCADGNGVCHLSGLPCDPQERALEQVRRLRAARQ